MDAPGGAGRRALQATDVPSCFLGLIHHATLGFLVTTSRCLPPTALKAAAAGAAGLPAGDGCSARCAAPRHLLICLGIMQLEAYNLCWLCKLPPPLMNVPARGAALRW